MIKVIFALFNLQGTALRQSFTRRLSYLSTSADLCQELFSRFFEEFSRFTFKPNSSIFSVVPSKLHQFLSLFVCRSLERLDILSHQSSFVNTFFQEFSTFLFLVKKGVKTHKKALKTLQNGAWSCHFKRMVPVAVHSTRTPAHNRPILHSLAI